MVKRKLKIEILQSTVTVPVFPATQEAEITRIILQEKPLIKARCGGKHLLSRSVGGINRRIMIKASLGSSGKTPD
jgi:hypothetical protein